MLKHERKLTLPYLIALGVDSTVGLGIYFSAGTVANALGERSVLLFVLCGAALSLVAFVFARLARLTERNGGAYIYTSLAFGSRAAYPLGWMDWLGAAIGLGGISAMLAETLGASLGSPLLGKAIGVGVLLMFGFLNYLGLTAGARAMAGLTLLKLFPLVAIGAAGLLPHGGWAAVSVAPSFAGWSSVVLLVLFSCQGFETVSIVAGESREPKRAIPVATLASLWISIGLYALIQHAAAARAPFTEPESALFSVASSFWGPAAAAALRGALLISVLGLLAARVLVAPRYLSPLAEDGLCPRFLSSVHERYSTPVPALAVTMVVAVAVCVAINPGQFMELSALGIALQYLGASLALVRLSWKEGKISSLGLAASAVSVFLLAQAPSASWKHLLFVTALGQVGYWTWLTFRNSIFSEKAHA